MAVIKHDIVLNDGVSKPAKSAAASVSGVSREMTLMTKALASAQDRMTKASATGNLKGFQSASKDVSNLKLSMAGLPAETSAASDGLATLTSGFAMAAAAAAAFVIGLGALIIKGAMFAISASQAKREMISMFDAMGGGVVTGVEVDDMLSDLSDRIGISKDALGGMTKEFLQMGVTGVGELERLTLAAESANAIVGKGGAEAFTDLQKKIQLAAESGGKFTLGTKQLLNLRKAGVGVSDIATKMGMSTEKLTQGLAKGTINAKAFGDAMTEAIIEKGAGPLKTLASSFESIKGKFLQSIGDMFEDIDVGPFMSEMADLFSIFGQAKPSGQAMKAGIVGFFKELFAVATKVVPLVKLFFLDMIIFALKAYIAAKPLVKWFQDIGGNEEAMSAIRKTLYGIGVGLAIVAAAAVVVVGAFAGFIAIVAIIGHVEDAILGFIVRAVMAIVEWVKGAPQMATDFVMGLVAGITGGAGSVVGAVTGLASKALAAFSGPSGIDAHSPSKKMQAQGLNMGDGLSGGMDQSAGGVAASAGSMAGTAMASVSGAASGGGNTTSVGGATTIDVGGITIDGAGKSAEQITEEMVATVFERFALQAGT